MPPLDGIPRGRLQKKGIPPDRANPAIIAGSMNFRPLLSRLAPLLLLGGCSVAQTAVELPAETLRAVTPGRKEAPKPIPADLQETVIRFSDNLLINLTRNAGKLQRAGKPVDPAEVLRWKLALGSETVSIASGANPLANLLDLTICVILTAESLETHWKPKAYGDSADPLLATFRRAEEDLWRIVVTVVPPPQIPELRKAIDAWKKENPTSESQLVTRALGFAAQAGSEEKARPGSLFGLINLDPLSSLDPATQEIARSRAFAERGLYVVQKLPQLLRWQTELLALEAAEIPVVRQMVASAARIAETAEKLPERLSREREEIVKALREQEKEVASVLTAGTQMSASLNTTIASFDALMKRFGVGEPPVPGATPAPPFRIEDYTKTAAQLDATAKTLTELVRALDHTVATTDGSRLAAQVTPVVQRVETGGKELVDHAFRKGCLLVGVVFLAALAYRFLAVRLAKPR